MYPVIPTGRRIRESLEPRLGRRGGQSRFISSEKRQSTCAFCFCHGDSKVRPKAIEVNRAYLLGMRADRRPRPDIFGQRIDIADFDVGWLHARPFGARAQEPTRRPISRAV